MPARKTLRRSALSLTLAALCAGSGASLALAQQAGEVNLYTTRQPFLIEPLIEAFQKETGIKVNTLFAESGLAERIQAEGANSPADLLMTVDIGNLQQAVDLGVTQPIESEVVEQAVPENLRGQDWTALSLRGRVIYAPKDSEITEIDYADLADPKWEGKICTRSGQHPYNISLIASMIAHEGEEAAEEWLRGVKNNLARQPAGNDREQAKGIFAGECELAIMNTYYYGAMANNDKEPEQKEWAESVKILLPNADDRGTHVNVSGVALAKNAPNEENAVRFIEYLVSDEAQKIYAEANYEYPVKPGVEVTEEIAQFGELNPDEISLEEVAANRAKASELVDKVAFDEGPAS